MEYIRRSIEERLWQYVNTYKAVLVTGPRQVGKSTLLKKVFSDRKYVSLDDPFLEEQAREDGDLFLSFHAPPVTIDEVQRAEELFRYIKLVCDGTEEKGLFCLSGSQQFHLMKNVSESLSGTGQIAGKCDGNSAMVYLREETGSNEFGIVVFKTAILFLKLHFSLRFMYILTKKYTDDSRQGCALHGVHMTITFLYLMIAAGIITILYRLDLRGERRDPDRQMDHRKEDYECNTSAAGAVCT